LPASPERHHDRLDLSRFPIDPDIESDSPGTAGERGASRWPRLSPWVLAAVFGGGIAGGLARYGIECAIATSFERFPWDDFIVNLSGAFGLAVLLVLALEWAPALRQLRPAIGTGFFGAFTTFSSLAVGIDRFVSHGRPVLAVTYGAGSIVGGLAAASLGLVVGRAIVANRSDAAAGVRSSGELTGSSRG
jgi:CrcB protein